MASSIAAMRRRRISSGVVRVAFASILLLSLRSSVVAFSTATPKGRLSSRSTTTTTTTIPKFGHQQSRLYSAAAAAASDDENKSDPEVLSQSQKRALTGEFLKIGGPALIQLAAEPLASLVDTAYLGRLGPEVLGGAGVAVSAQYAVSKLYNDPLLRTSISLVASQDGKQRGEESDSESSTDQQQRQEQKQKDLSIAVSSAILLAATVGLIQLIVYSVFCKGISRSMGLTPASPMWFSCVSYLQIRALGTPAATLWLVTNGIFRGLGDTRTPLVYSLAFTALNAALDPLFIFGFKWGASGAAAGTALAQYIALVPLLLALNRRVPINVVGQFKELKSSLQAYLRAGGFVLFRTVGKVLAYSVCARQAALLGSVAAAAYNLTFQLGFATTQICEAVAVAVQTLLAREMSSSNNSEKKKAQIVRHLINTAVMAGGGVATALSFVTYARRNAIVAGLTTNPAIQTAALSIFPVVLTTQILKGLAYPVNGIIMGGLDWFFSMVVMWIANLACVGSIRYFLRGSVGGAGVSLSEIWWALAAFMGTQVVAGIIRYESKTGIWSILKGQGRKEKPSTA